MLNVYIYIYTVVQCRFKLISENTLLNINFIFILIFCCIFCTIVNFQAFVFVVLLIVFNCFYFIKTNIYVLKVVCTECINNGLGLVSIFTIYESKVLQCHHQYHAQRHAHALQKMLKITCVYIMLYMARLVSKLRDILQFISEIFQNLVQFDRHFLPVQPSDEMEHDSALCPKFLQHLIYFLMSGQLNKNSWQ